VATCSDSPHLTLKEVANRLKLTSSIQISQGQIVWRGKTITDDCAKTILRNAWTENFHKARVRMTFAMVHFLYPFLVWDAEESIEKAILITVSTLSPSDRQSIAQSEFFIHHFEVSTDGMSVLLLDYVLRRTWPVAICNSDENGHVKGLKEYTFQRVMGKQEDEEGHKTLDISWEFST